MSWLRKAAARVVFRASGSLMKLGMRLVASLPEPNSEPDDDDEDIDIPPQNPMTPEARAMLVDPPQPPPRPGPVVEVLEGSARERYLRRRKQQGFD